VAGTWTRRFTDEFSGTTIDRSRWTTLDGWRMNNVTTRDRNVTVTGGHAVLTLSSATEGAELDSAPYDGAGANGYLLPVGGFVEARIMFPGDGTDLYNWPAWWASGPNWPAAGEHDIAEVLGGDLTVNYHSPNVNHNLGEPTGYWGDEFHTYGLHRKAGSADVYFDGRLVETYRTEDNGQGEALLINIGVGQGSRTVTGAAGAVKVDYVRAWQ
jgi:beta-glucanase (GH16 family)